MANSDSTEDKIVKWVVGILLVIGAMWLFELGPFEKSTPTPTYHPYQSSNSQPSFGGRTGPCTYTETYTDKKCTCKEWRSGSGPGMCICGHDITYH